MDNVAAAFMEAVERKRRRVGMGQAVRHPVAKIPGHLGSIEACMVQRETVDSAVPGIFVPGGCAKNGSAAQIRRRQAKMPERRGFPQENAIHVDRKSTRLNSSHVSESRMP